MAETKDNASILDTLSEQGRVHVSMSKGRDGAWDVILTPLGYDGPVARGFVTPHKTAPTWWGHEDEPAEHDEPIRWWAFDESRDRSRPVGDPDGYESFGDAAMAIVRLHGRVMMRTGVALDGREEGEAGVSEGDFLVLPYLDGERKPIVKTLRTSEHPISIYIDGERMLDDLMGGFHPGATRLAKAALAVISCQGEELLPALWEMGVDPVLSITTRMLYDSYGNAILDGGDPFCCISLQLDWQEGDGGTDDSQPMKASLGIGVYDPDIEEGDQLTHFVSVSGDGIPSNVPFGHDRFSDRGAHDVTAKRDVALATEAAFAQFLAVIALGLLSREKAGGKA